MYLLKIFGWGLGSRGEPHIGSVVLLELAFLIFASLVAVFALKRTSWSLWLGLIPVCFTILSTPLLLQFDGFWIEQGFQPAEVAGLINMSRLAMVISILVIVWTADWQHRAHKA